MVLPTGGGGGCVFVLVQAKCRTMPHETTPGNHCHTRVLFDTYAATFCSKTADRTSASPHFVVGSTRMLVSQTCGPDMFGHSHVNMHVNDYAPRRVSLNAKSPSDDYLGSCVCYPKI